MTMLEQTQRFEDLLGLQTHDMPYVFGRIFRDDGWWARRLSKKKLKLLKRLDPVIRPMLHEGEKVFFLTSGVESSILESQFFGWAVYFLNQRAFVLTNERILLVQIDGRGRPKELRAQIAYPAIEAIQRSLGGSCRIKYVNGRTSVFGGVPKHDRGFLQETISLLKERLGTAPPTVAAVENLCPHCYQRVVGFPERCPACAGALKSPRKAALLSLLFPGIGDFYLGHRGLATMEVLGAAVFWTAFTLPLADGGGVTVEWIVAALIFFLLVHGMDALATRHIARKGLYPAG